MKRTLIITFFLCFVVNAKSQTNLNNYKYVVVPLQYNFLKEKDMYRLNTLTRFLFKEKGFNVYFDNEKQPEDLYKNGCLAIYVDVKKLKGLLNTKLQIELKNCKGEMIMISTIGKSKEKVYNKAYGNALRKAFSTLKYLDYNYDADLITKESITKNETALTENRDTSQLEIIETKNIANKNQDPPIYYAQKIENGFQLVDTEPKVIMILLTTAAKNVYLVKDKNAIIFKDNDVWYYSENNGQQKNKEQLKIKF